MAVNRVKTTALIPSITDSFYNEMNSFDKVAWCMGPVPYEILSIMKVGNFLSENTAARIAAAKMQDMFLEASNLQGLSIEVCSYAKLNIGQAILMTTGREEEIPEKFRLPRPDFVAVGTACPSMMQWGKCIAEIFNVPLFVWDMPFDYGNNNESFMRNAQYCKAKLEEFIVFLEKVTGRPFDWERLNEVISILRETANYRRQIYNLCKIVPTPCSFIDAAVAMAPSITMKDERACGFYKQFSEELLDRACHGIATCENEQYRIMWRGNFPWYKVGHLSKLFDKYNAVLVSGEYGFLYYGEHAEGLLRPDGFDLKDPLLTIAAEYVRDGYAQTFEHKWESEFQHYIDDFAIDGVIIHSPHTCRPWGLTTYDMAARVEKEYGIPAIVLELDHVDQSYFQEAQVETRVKALLETIDANRAMGKGRQLK